MISYHTKEFWDNYYNTRPIDQDRWCSLTYDPNISKCLSSLEGIHDILEIGCGKGINTKGMSDKGYNVTGIDISEVAIREAKKNYPDLNFIQIDIKDFSSDKKFDLILDRCTYYLSGNLYSPIYINKVSSLIKEGGYWLIYNIFRDQIKDTVNSKQFSLIHKKRVILNKPNFVGNQFLYQYNP